MKSRLPCLLLLALAVLPWRALAEAADGDEPERCQQAIAKRPEDPVRALRDAEGEQWRAARRAGKRARKAHGRALALDPGRAPTLRSEVDEAQTAFFGAVAAAQELCRCRLTRGDATEADCQREEPSRR